MDFNVAGELTPEQQKRIVTDTVDNFNQYLNRWPEPRPVDGAAVEWFGEGCLLRDVSGREFIDCLGGFGIFALGHRHPKVIAAVKAQIDRMALHSQWMLNPRSADAAPRLAGITPGHPRKTLWCWICTERGVLMLLDEVQTGFGRTGKMFGCNHSGVVPDVISLGKAISGGVIPCAAFHTTDRIFDSFHPNPFYHTSTFGANPMATTAAAATIQTLQEENLIARSAEMGEYFRAGLRQLQKRFPEIIRDVRGRGLLIGVEIVDARVGESLAQRMFDRNVLIAYTLNKPEVIRIEPPLIITRDLIDTALERFEESLREESEH